MELFADLNIGFIGAGNMATAIIRGLLARRLIPAANIHITDILADKTRALAEEHGVRACATPAQLIDATQIVILAVKPQDLLQLLDSNRTNFGPRHLVVSIAAGIRIDSISARLPAQTRVVRVMPNTPALVGVGASGVAAGSAASPADMELTLELFRAVGIAVTVDESQLDAITALSGSGPAYVFRFVELMAATGQELGLDARQAHELTVQTFEGALKLLRESGEPPQTLRERVTSKGGTTAAALDSFESGGLPALIQRSLTAARDRSIELSREAD